MSRSAYEVLSDASKRQAYDHTGNTGEGSAADYESGNFHQEDIFSHFKASNRGRGKQGQHDFEDVLRDLFENGFNPNMNPNQRQGRQQRSEQQEVSTMNLSLSFEESVKGCTKVLEFERRCTCPTCSGSKCKPGTKPDKCRSCDGSGMQAIRQGIFVMQTPCGSCAGSGEKIKHFCGNCNGSGIEKRKVKEEVVVPRGINDGMTIRLAKKGNFNGDLAVKVQVRKSPVFGREGHNAVSELHISVIEAVLGA